MIYICIYSFNDKHTQRAIRYNIGYIYIYIICLWLIKTNSWQQAVYTYEFIVYIADQNTPIQFGEIILAWNHPQCAGFLSTKYPEQQRLQWNNSFSRTEYRCYVVLLWCIQNCISLYVESWLMNYCGCHWYCCWYWVSTGWTLAAQENSEVPSSSQKSPVHRANSLTSTPLHSRTPQQAALYELGSIFVEQMSIVVHAESPLN